MRNPASAGVRAIVWGGLAVGVLDFTAASVVWGIRGVTPARVARGIAAGLLGREAALSGGAASAALGVAIHFLIAFTAATVFWLASRRLPWLLRKPLASGALYGVAVFAFMHYVVMPLAFTTPRRIQPGWELLQVGIHVVCVGWPIAFAARRAAHGPAPAPGRAAAPAG